MATLVDNWASKMHPRMLIYSSEKMHVHNIVSTDNQPMVKKCLSSHSMILINTETALVCWLMLTAAFLWLC
jgi:hypothetical protein